MTNNEKNFSLSFSSTALLYDCIVKLVDGGGSVTHLGNATGGDRPWRHFYRGGIRFLHSPSSVNENHDRDENEK